MVFVSTHAQNCINEGVDSLCLAEETEDKEDETEGGVR